jgi:hypothetical protein
VRLTAAGLALAGIAGLFARIPPQADACTPAPSPDPIAASDVIVAGRIIGWQVATDIERPTPATPDSYEPVPIRLYLDVDRAYKGTTTTDLEFVNEQSLDYQDGRFSWTFATFSCGDFREDPTGTYTVIGLARGEDGTLREAARFFEGETAAGSEFEDVISHLGPGYFPAAGGPPAASGPSGETLVVVASVVGIAVAVVVLAALHGRRIPGE